MTVGNCISNHVLPDRTWYSNNHVPEDHCRYDGMNETVQSWTYLRSSSCKFSMSKLGARTSFGRKTADLLYYLFGSIVEKRFMTLADQTYETAFRCLPKLCKLPNWFCYEFKCSTCQFGSPEFMNPRRTYMRRYFDDAFKKLVCWYNYPRSTGGSFGTIFPNNPTSEGTPTFRQEDPATIGKLICILEMDGLNTSNLVSKAPWLRDITQRTTKGCTYKCILKLEPHQFHTADADYSPAFKHVAGLIRAIAEDDSSMTEFLDGKLCLDCSYPTCTLQNFCEDRVGSWLENIKNTIQQTHYWTLFPWFFSEDYPTKCRRNSFALDLMLSILNQFVKVQVASLSLDLYGIKHDKYETTITTEIFYDCENCKWDGKVTETTVGSTYSENDQAVAGVEICSEQFRRSYHNKAYVQPYVMYVRDSCGAEHPIYCYYKADGFDEPYIIAEYQDGWDWTTEGDVDETPLYIHATRYFPRAMTEPASRENQNASFTFGSKFPVMTDLTRPMLKFLKNHQFVRKDFCYDEEASSPTQERYSIFSTCYCKTHCDTWLEDSGYELFNKAIERYAEEINDYIAEKTCNAGYKAVTNVAEQELDADFFEASETDLKEALECYKGPGTPARYMAEYDKIVYNDIADAWFGITYQGICVQLAPSQEHTGYYTVASVNETVSWEAYGIPGGTDAVEAEAGITFGGYFQMIEWDPKYVNLK